MSERSTEADRSTREPSAPVVRGPRARPSADVLFPISVAIGTALALLPFARWGVDAHHDALMFKPALDVLAGQVLFRDTFSQYGVLTPLVHAAALGMFGRRLLVLRLLTVGLYALSAGLFAATWRRLMPRWLIVAAIVLWLACAPFMATTWVLLPWSSTLALCAQAFSMYALCRAMERARPTAWGVACGVGAAAAQLARTPVGVTHTVALFVAWLYLVWRSERRARAGVALVACLAGVVLTHLIALAWLVHIDALGPWYEQTIAVPGRWARFMLPTIAATVWTLVPLDSAQFKLTHLIRTRPLTPASYAAAVVFLIACLVTPILARRWSARALALGAALVVGTVLLLDPVLLTTPTILCIVVPVGLLLMIGWHVLARGARRDDVHSDSGTHLGVALALPALASWHQYAPLGDANHVFWAIAPMVIAFCWALWRVLDRRSVAVSILLAALAIPLGVGRVQDMTAKLAEPVRLVTGVPRLVGMYAAPGEAAFYESFQATLARMDQQTMMVVRHGDAMLATFVPNLRNWYPYWVEWIGLPPPSDDLSRFIDAHRPLVLIDRRKADESNRIQRDHGYRVIAKGPRNSVVLGPDPSTESSRPPEP
jgi:hypothetical protein